jgi:hypothetical protein
MEEVWRLIDQHPTVIESVLFLTLPPGVGPLSERMHQIQENAFHTMQRVCEEWKGKLKHHKKTKRRLLQDSINRNIANCKNEIGMQTQKMMNEVQGIENWEEERKANWERLSRLEKVLQQIVQRTDNEIKKNFTVVSHPIIKGRLAVSKHLLTVVNEREVDSFLCAHNETLSSCSSTSSSSCLICEEDPVEEERIVIAPCNHLCCKTCLRGHIQANQEENRFPIRCLARDCTTLLEEKYIVQAGIEGADLGRWRKQTLLQIPRVIRCPRDECDAFLLRGDEKKKDVLCGKCFKSICSRCIRAAHPGVACQDTGKIQQYIEGENGFEKLVQADIVQRCPHCQAPTIRTSACLHIDCKKCGKRWNYRGEYRSDEDKTIK